MEDQLNECELSFTDCLIKCFGNNSGNLETSYNFPSKLRYTQEQQNKLLQLSTTPGIPFPIIDGFGTPEDSFTTQREVLVVNSLITIEVNTLELRRFEDSNVFEVYFKYSAVSNVEISLHFVASLFSSSTMLSVERSVYASSFIPCPAGTDISFSSGVFHITADLMKHPFPTLQHNDTLGQSISDRFDIVLIVQKSNKHASVKPVTTINPHESSSSSSCFPFYNTVTTDIEQPPTNTNSATTTSPPPQTTPYEPVSIEKELYACTLSASAIQEIKSLLRLTMSLPLSNTSVSMSSKSNRTIKSNVEVMEIETVMEEEQVNRHKVSAENEVEDAKTKSTMDRIPQPTASPREYMDISTARREFTPPSSPNRPAKTIPNTAENPNMNEESMALITRIMTRQQGGGITIMNIALDISFRFYQVQTQRIPLSSVSTIRSNHTAQQFVCRDMDIYGLTSSNQQSTPSIVSTSKKVDMNGLEIAEDNVCVICMSNPKDIMFYPCRHTHVCHSCFEMSIQTSRRTNETNSLSQCPVCRERVKLALHFPGY